jgi:ATP phosphoribosyltransferase
MALLSEAGISTMGGHRKLMVRASGFPMEVLYLRDDDIPQAVSMGVTDIGIVGLNEVEERGFSDVDVVMKLGFGACRISLAVPRDADYNGPEWFNGKRVATSYPHILKKYFDSHGIQATIHEIAGSVEVAPAVGMADAIFDIVSSGGTLLQNGLVEVEQVLQSEAVLIASRELTDEKRTELGNLQFRFNSIAESRGMKYLLMNLPEASIERAVAILPGMKSPTLLPLVEPGWFSLQAVIKESELWDKIQQLKEVGAEDILVLQLENIIR